MPFRLWIVSLALTSLAATGCASYRPHALPVRMVEEYPNAVALGDVRIAAEAFDKTTCKRILSRSANSKGYVPVLIALENKGEDRVVVDGANIELEAGGGQVHQRTASEVVATKCQKSVGLHVFFLGLFSGLGAADYNQNMAEDWKAKELPSQVVLEPHSTKSGLLFYAIKNFSSVHNATLTIPVAVGTRRDYEEVRCVLP